MSSRSRNHNAALVWTAGAKTNDGHSPGFLTTLLIKRNPISAAGGYGGAMDKNILVAPLPYADAQRNKSSGSLRSRWTQARFARRTYCPDERI